MEFTPLKDNESSATKFANKLDFMIKKSVQRQDQKLWKNIKPLRGIVNIGLVDGKDLRTKPDESLPDPYVRFKLGNEKCKSKVKQKTVNPYWCEQFDLYIYEDQDNILEISVKSDDLPTRELTLGECTIDMRQYNEEKTHHLELPLGEKSGFINILLTVSMASEKRRFVHNKSDAKVAYAYWRTLSDMTKIGWLQLTVIKAQNLLAADITGTSDPFCIVELDNNRLQTHTVYKTLDPDWNKTFSISIKDIHSVLHLTVYDENPNKKQYFLGKVAIPLLRLRCKQDVWYQLKNESLKERSKGALLINADYVYNPLRAAIKTFRPKEKILMKPEPKLKVSIMKNNIGRAQKLCKIASEDYNYFISCVSPRTKMKSFTFLLLYSLVIMSMELYMFPLLLLLILLRNLFLANLHNDFKDADVTAIVTEDDTDFEAKMEDISKLKPIDVLDERRNSTPEEKKSFMVKFQAVQEVCLTVQEFLNEAVSFYERVKNLFKWKVPWISSLVFMILLVVTIIFYFIPFRIILLLMGFKFFMVRFFRPDTVDTNKFLELLSRVHSDKELYQYRELPRESNLYDQKYQSKLKT